MDWNLFWNAFGAIGTTIGSVVTAVAVVIAVKQYRQPLKKIVKVEFTSAIAGDKNGNSVLLYNITVKNKGIRSVQINSLFIAGKKKNLWIDNAQHDSVLKKELPIKIEPEESVDFWFEMSNFRNGIKTAVDENALNGNKKMVIFVTDSLGERYFCKTNIRINSLIKDI